MIYVYYGLDYGQVVDKCYQDINKISNNLNVIKYNGFIHYIRDVIEECSSFSLFDEKKLIVFENCYFLSSNKIKAVLSEQKKQFDLLKDYIKDQSGYDLVLIVPGLLESKNEIVSLLKEHDAIINEVKPFLVDDYIEYGLKKAKENNVSITKDALSELFNRTKEKINYTDIGNFLHFNNELNKLFTFSKDIKLNDVCNLVNKPLEEDIFQTVSSLLSKNINNAISSYTQLRNIGYLPLELLPIFVSQFRDYALLKFNMEENKSDVSIMNELNLSKGRLYYSKKTCMYYSYSTFIKILSCLGEIEKGIKLYQDDGDIRLLTFFSTFQTKFKN